MQSVKAYYNATGMSNAFWKRSRCLPSLGPTESASDTYYYNVCLCGMKICQAW